MSRVPLERLSAEEVGPVCLVTGGAGFFGTHLLAALVDLGCTVRSLDVRPCGVPGVTDHVGDVRSVEHVASAMAGVDTVFHAAAVLTLSGHAPRAVRDRIVSVNVEGTTAVLQAAARAGVGRLVHTSSANVCIARSPVVDVGEDDAPYAEAFVDLYGRTKRMAEEAVLQADTPGGLRTCALRPGGLWGGGDGGLMIRAFLEQVASGSFVATIGDGRSVVDNTHVDNLVWAELLAAARLGSTPERVGGQAYFITDDERVNGITWFRPLTEGLGVPWPRWRLPGALMYGIGWLGELVHALGAPEPPLTRIGILKLTVPSGFLVDKAREHLGWDVLVRHEEGLADHMDDYRAMLEDLRGT